MSEHGLDFEQRREAAVLIDLMAHDEDMVERVAFELIAIRARVAELAATDWRLKWPACGLWKEMT